MKKKQNFWTKENGKVHISQTKLIEFLNNAGFAKAKKSETEYVLVQEKNKTVREITDFTIIDYITDYLKKLKEPVVLETFTKGLANFVSSSKLKLLKTVKIISDRDDKDSSWFYFKNICCQVDKKSITSLLYEDFPYKIWESRIIDFDFYPSDAFDVSQFEMFCKNISGNCEKRLKCLMSIIGYLLHRYQDPANARAIILVDENISNDQTANGGTGKSLLLKAISICREVVVIDGKHFKSNNQFKNQRINRTTDIVFYDDVKKDFSLETLYSMITTGVSVEKKYKTEEYIKPENAPKICISSNYIVTGTGGSTDLRRRCDFELNNHYNVDYQPIDEFGNLFFDNSWKKGEWSGFFLFLMKCVQVYLNNGLILPEAINLNKNRLISETSIDFVSFMDLNIIEHNKWYSKNEIYKLFISEYKNHFNLSPNMLTKWLKAYSRLNGLKYEDRKSGNKFEFYIKDIERKEAGDEK